MPWSKKALITFPNSFCHQRYSNSPRTTPLFLVGSPEKARSLLSNTLTSVLSIHRRLPSSQKPIGIGIATILLFIINNKIMNCLFIPALIIAAVLHASSTVDATSSTRSLQKTYDTINGRSCFRSLDGMIESMKDLATKYPDLITMESIGESYIKKNNPNPSDYGRNFNYDLPSATTSTHST